MAPTLTAVVQQQTRVLLTLTWPGVQQATIQRLDPDGVLRNVRNAEPAVCQGACAVFDHEAPLDQAVTYQATSPQGTGIVASDTFTRTLSGSWGTADVGGSWTLVGTAADFSTTGTRGRIVGTTLNDEYIPTLNISSPNVKVDADLRNETDAATGDLRIGLVGRMTDLNNYYLGELWISPTKQLTLRIGKRVAGAFVVLASQLTTLTQVGGNFRTTHFTVQGSTLTLSTETASLSVTDTSLTTGNLAGCFVRNETASTTQAFLIDNVAVTDLTPLTVTSSPVTSSSGGQAWLTHPGHPQYAAAISTAKGGLAETRPARTGVFYPIGAELPIAVSDVRGGSTGTLTIITQTTADITRLRAMLADSSPLLLRQPLTFGGDSWYLSIGDTDIGRITMPAPHRTWVLPYRRVDRPAGLSDGAVGQTVADVKATYATCALLLATGKTCLTLAQSVT